MKEYESSSSVKTVPHFMFGLFFIWWGVLTENLFLGIVTGVVLELPSFIKIRWNLEEKDFIRISDITSLLVVSTAVISYMRTENIQVFREFVMWLPLALFPVAFAQLYSSSDKIVIGTAIGFGKGKQTHKHKPMDVSWYYLMIVFFSAASPKGLGWGHAAGFLLLSLWILFSVRNRDYSSVTVFMFLFAVLVIAGFEIFAHVSLSRALNRFIYRNYISRQKRLDYDGIETYTSMGESGRITLSGQIVMRVRNVDKSEGFFYLRESVYNRFHKKMWYSSEKEFKGVAPDIEGEYYFLDDELEKESLEKMTVHRDFVDGESGVLALPHGVYTVKNLTAAGVSFNSLGTVKIDEGAGFLQYDVFYSDKRTFLDSAPVPSDFEIPENEVRIISELASELELQNKELSEIVDTVKSYFSGYSYSLELPDMPQIESPVGWFLEDADKGHCEFFASAAVLLFREAGIPARYVNGYLVDEYSDFTESYVVRESDAHAWIVVFDKDSGSWLTVEVTPPALFSSSMRDSGFFSVISDFFSGIVYNYRIFREEKGEKMNTWLVVIVVFLSAILLLKVYFRKKVVHSDLSGRDKKHHLYEKIETSFYKVADFLVKRGAPPRRRNQTYSAWTNILIKQGSVNDAEGLKKLAEKHNHIKFSLQKDSASFKELEKMVSSWIEKEKNC